MESYSKRVKSELLRIMPDKDHCRIAEAAGFFYLSGSVRYEEDIIHADLEGSILKKYFTLLKKTNIVCSYGVGQKEIKGDEAFRFLSLIGYDRNCPDRLPEEILSRDCCRKSFLRGAFLASGSVTDPDKGYHLEITARTKEEAHGIITVMASFLCDGKMVLRQERPVVYLKESGKIADILTAMGASAAMLDLENTKVRKEMNNTINRKVNCETANIGKMVDAAIRELNDIKLIEEKIGLDNISPRLAETARLRLSHPDLPLQKLGKMHEPPVGKSGVNHRLRRICKIASDIRDQEEFKRS
jgi:hypothetical protein